MAAPTVDAVRRLSNEPRTARRKWLRALLSHRSLMIGAIALTLIFVTALFSPVIATQSPGKTDTAQIMTSPNSGNVFGTDHYGRDVYSRVVFGSRISMIVGFSVILIAGFAGGMIGLISGYVQQVDNIVMRIIDLLMAFPGFVLALGLMAILGAHLGNVIIALSIMSIPGVARVIRGSTLQFKEMQYVEAARAIGCRGFRILSRHIFPNCVAPFLVQLTLVFAGSVLAEAGLSFIGAGVPPDVPSWGIILSEGRNYLQTAPWMALFAGIAISITVLAVNLFGDGLRDVTDPHLRHR